MEQLQQAMQAVERACAAVQVPDAGIRASAEVALLEFKRSPHPFQACQYILDNSQMATARFQAAGTIQEAAIREWALLSPEEKTTLRTYCLQYVMARAEVTTEGYVLSKILSVVAALLKRGWLEYTPEEKESFFNEIHQAVVGRHGLSAQRSGISLLESLISEFSPSTASPMGLPAEFHDHCRASLELEYLQKFYSWGLDALVIVAGKAIEGQEDTQEAAIATIAVRVMSQILNWDFHGNVIRGGKQRFSSTYNKKYPDYSHVSQVGLAWNELLSTERVMWIMNLYSHIRQKSSGAYLDSPLAVVLRQLIIQMCSLSGSIFSGVGGVTQEKHLHTLLAGILPWIDPPDHIISMIISGANESELLDGCRALLGIATMCSPSSFDQLLKQTRFSGTFSLLSSLTCGIIKVTGDQQSEESHWSEEALDLLLEIWTVMLQPADLSIKIPLPPAGLEAAFAVFHTYVECEMKVSEASALDEDDAEENMPASVEAREEQQTTFALIARTTPSTTIPLLNTLVSKCCSGLRQCPRTEEAARYLEQLHWLTIISGHVLADPGEGETPMVPESILALCADPGTNPAIVLSCSLIELAQQSLDATFRANVLSPRLMEAIIWFFGRWVDTYLMPDDSGRGPSSTPSGQEGNPLITVNIQLNSFNTAFGKDGAGLAVLEILVRVAVTALTAWHGELVLQERVCFGLLPAMVRRKAICTQLVSLGAWQELATVFARQDQILVSLPVQVQRALSESLCRSAAGLENADAMNQYIKELLMSMVVILTSLSQRKDLAAFSQQPGIMHQVSCLLERLRGAARATLPRSQKAHFEIGMLVMQPLLVFMEVYKNQPSVVYLLLKYVVVWVEAQVVFLEPKDTAMVFNFCVKLLSVYSAHNIGKISISASENLLNERQTEKYKDLRALLQLLTNLSSKDLIDFSHTNLDNPDVAQVVYLGLNIISPLISADLLKYPKLCRQYFTLLMHMLEVYPEKVAKLSPEDFSQIISTLQFGIHHQDTEVVNMTFNAISAVAVFHYQALCKGQEGLGIYATGGESVLSHFLKSLVHFLLFEDYSNDLVEPAADALLPLILCNPDVYERLKQELVEGQRHVAARERLKAAFADLSSNSNQSPWSTERSHRRRFRENLYVFLNDVRGFLRTSTTLDGRVKAWRVRVYQ